MSITQRNRRNRWPEANLFLQETEHSRWDQIPERDRQEAIRLMARMFIALVARSERVAAEEEDDHE
jgi:hypothetical protein